MEEKLTNNTGSSNTGGSDGNDSSLRKYLIPCKKMQSSEAGIQIQNYTQKNKKNTWNNWYTKHCIYVMLCCEELTDIQIMNCLQKQ